jgi:16S rRNA (guanine966-N2)-methyltransferase
MRIIAGKFRGRRLATTLGEAVRPTSDRAREALFSILAHGDLKGDGTGLPQGVSVCDAFCGSGALGLEALSRGATHAIFIDNSRDALASAKANAEALGVMAQCHFILGDACKPPGLKGEPVSLLFLDPPYGSGLAGSALLAIEKVGWLTSDSLAVVEIAAAEPFEAPAPWFLRDERRYGAARLALLGRKAD